MIDVHVNDRKKRRGHERGGEGPPHRETDTRRRWRLSDPPEDSFSGDWRCLVWVPDRPPADGGFVSRILFITGQKTGRDAASAHERDNPGNNMRTLSLSRRLGVDLQRCGLPEVRGKKGVKSLLCP